MRYISYRYLTLTLQTRVLYELIVIYDRLSLMLDESE